MSDFDKLKEKINKFILGENSSLEITKKEAEDILDMIETIESDYL